MKRMTFRLKNRTIYALLFTSFLVMILSQNLFAIILAPQSHLLSKMVISIKDLILYSVLFMVGMFYSNRLVKFRLPVDIRTGVFFFLFVILCYLIIFRSFNLLSLRQLLIIPLFLGLGYYISKRVSLEQILKLFIPVVFLIVITSLFERYLLFDSTESFWSRLGMYEYMKMKGFALWAWGPGGTPGSFYSHDFSWIYRLPLRRTVGLLMADPMLLGQFMQVPVLYTLFAKKWLGFILFSCVTMMTISKGGILGILIGYAIFQWQHGKSKFIKMIMVTITSGIIVCMLYISMTGQGFSSVKVHVAGLLLNLNNSVHHPLGQGIGAAGNFSVMAAIGKGVSNSEAEGSGESYLGAVIGQLGIIGLGFYLFLFKYIYQKNVLSLGPFAMGIKYGALGTLIAGIASESAITYVGSGYIFALIPFIFRKSKIDTEDTYSIQSA